MDRTEPQVTTAPQETLTEQNIVRRFINKTGNFINDNKNKLATRLTASATAGVLAITLAGCGTAAAESPAPAPSTSTSAEATPEETETPETPTIPEIVSAQAELDYLTFEQGDASAKRAYAMYFVEQNIDRHLTLHEENKDRMSGPRPTWTEPSLDLTGQEIINNWVYVLDDARLSTEFKAETGKHYLDQDQAIKVLSAAYYNTDDFADNPMYSSSYNAMVENFLNSEKGIIVIDNSEDYREVTSTEVFEGVGPNGEPLQFKDIEFSKPGEENINARFAYTSYTNAEGEEDSTWLFFKYVEQ